MPGEIVTSEPIQPRRAIVTPRARREGLTAAVSLQSLIEPIIARGMKGDVEIVGAPGSGKSAALAHLAAVLPNQENVEFCEEYCPRLKKISIVTRRVRSAGKTLSTFFLAEWTIDDCMEYLATMHRDRARSVLARLSDDSTFDRLVGLPHLFCHALDRMAENESIEHAFDAARDYVLGLARKKDLRKKIGGLAIQRIKHPTWFIKREEYPPEASSELICLLEEIPVQRIFAAEALVEGLKVRKEFLVRFLPEYTKLIFNDVVTALRHRPVKIDAINRVFQHANRHSDSIAASLLLAIDPNWRIAARHPHQLQPYQLQEALLSGAKWSGIDLQHAMLAGADFSGADLSMSSLRRASARETIFQGANLSNANLAGIDADKANFADALLCDFDGTEGSFERANFTRANLQNAILSDAKINMADLTNADLRNARMNSAWMMSATLEVTNFSHADLTRIACCDCDFRESILDHTNFTKASMLGCNLEGMEIVAGLFEFADFTGAYLTASRMPRANFRGTKLCSAGLADIQWENADLRDADFTNASFHMGSTRCGLVDSDLASEGTRTGFYTDDFNEQEFRAPEEIRKANLCGADLRGAKVKGCDFYLVDLRNAKYTEEQATHFAKCGAILRSRVT
jgi:uncharacterized protein YjbI with pentapeptide repeats